MDVLLARHLLLRREHGLDLAQVDEHHPRVVALLDDAGDQVALAPDVLAERDVVLGLAQPLQDHLPRGRRGDPAEVVRGVVELASPGAVLAGRLAGPDRDVPGLAVELDAGESAAPSVWW